MDKTWTPQDCALHEQQLRDLRLVMDALTKGQNAILTAQGRIDESISGLRREMDSGFKGVYRRQDLTNGRVTRLESDTGKLKVDMAAQEAFTPGMFKDIAELRHDTDEAVKEMEHSKGFMSGAAKAGLMIWAALLATVAAGAWLWERFISPGRTP